MSDDLNKSVDATGLGCAPFGSGSPASGGPTALTELDVVGAWLSDLWVLAHRRDLPPDAQKQIERDVDHIRELLGRVSPGAEPAAPEDVIDKVWEELSGELPESLRTNTKYWRSVCSELVHIVRSVAPGAERTPAGTTAAEMYLGRYTPGCSLCAGMGCDACAVLPVGESPHGSLTHTSEYDEKRCPTCVGDTPEREARGFLPEPALRTILEHHNLVDILHRGDAWHQQEALLREIRHYRSLRPSVPPAGPGEERT